MIKIDLHRVNGLDEAMAAMRNPKESWELGDSGIYYDGLDENPNFRIGQNDMDLSLKLIRSGTDHSKHVRFIDVYANITAPLYWWKEFDTYRFGVEKLSTSTMHTLHKGEITIADFSAEDLSPTSRAVLTFMIQRIEELRRSYLTTHEKEYWREMIQLLPSSWNQMRTVKVSYQALRNMYGSRRHHKLKEWRQFCGWIQTLPYSRFITEGFDE